MAQCSVSYLQYADSVVKGIIYARELNNVGGQDATSRTNATSTTPLALPVALTASGKLALALANFS